MKYRSHLTGLAPVPRRPRITVPGAVGTATYLWSRAFALGYTSLDSHGRETQLTEPPGEIQI